MTEKRPRLADLGSPREPLGDADEVEGGDEHGYGNGRPLRREQGDMGDESAGRRRGEPRVCSGDVADKEGPRNVGAKVYGVERAARYRYFEQPGDERLDPQPAVCLAEDAEQP